MTRPNACSDGNGLGVAGGEAASDIEQLEPQAVDAGGPEDGPGEIDRPPVGTGVERLRADVEREPVRLEPERARLDEQVDGSRRVDPELACERHAAHGIGRVDAHVDAGAGRVLGELRKLAARVCREAIETQGECTRHVRGGFDGIAVEHALRVDPERDEHAQLGQGRDLEPRAEGREPRQQGGLGVALHGVVQADPGSARRSDA